MTREEIISGLETLAIDACGAMVEASTRKDENANELATRHFDILNNAIKLLDGQKHKAIWEDKAYHCPICFQKLNPSYQKECPDCHIRILYKKSGKD